MAMESWTEESKAAGSAFVPDFAELVRRLGVSADAFAAEEMTISSSVLKFLISEIVSNQDFDEAWYLLNYPDVRQAVEAGVFKSGLDHYAKHGYFEGRPINHHVDENWYLRQYQEIATEVQAGRLHSGSAHYHAMGRSEGRSGSAAELDARKSWDAVAPLP